MPKEFVMKLEIDTSHPEFRFRLWLATHLIVLAQTILGGRIEILPCRLKRLVWIANDIVDGEWKGFIVRDAHEGTELGCYINYQLLLQAMDQYGWENINQSGGEI